MRTLLTTLALTCLTTFINAQTAIQKNFSVAKGEHLTLKFDYPQLIKITTWKQNEVSISGSVSINNGEDDSLFELTENKNGNEKTIEGKITNIKDIKQNVIVVAGDKKLNFKSKGDYQNYLKENNINVSSSSMSSQIDIVLEIKVPEHMKTFIESTYGTVEIKNFNAPLVAKSIYGSVDAALNEKQVGEIKAETFFGKMYTNLDSPVKTIKSDHFHSIIATNVGKEPLQEFSSKYGNVYLRK